MDTGHGIVTGGVEFGSRKHLPWDILGSRTSHGILTITHGRCQGMLMLGHGTRNTGQGSQSLTGVRDPYHQFLRSSPKINFYVFIKFYKIPENYK